MSREMTFVWVPHYTFSTYHNLFQIILNDQLIKAMKYTEALSEANQRTK